MILVPSKKLTINIRILNHRHIKMQVPKKRSTQLVTSPRDIPKNLSDKRQSSFDIQTETPQKRSGMPYRMLPYYYNQHPLQYPSLDRPL